MNLPLKNPQPEIKDLVGRTPVRFVRDSIKSAMSKYVKAFNLKGLTSRLGCVS